MVGYDFGVGQYGLRGWRTWLNDTKMTLNFRNLLDKDPPFRSDPGAGFYSRYEDPRGLFISMQIDKRI